MSKRTSQQKTEPSNAELHASILRIESKLESRLESSLQEILQAVQSFSIEVEKRFTTHDQQFKQIDKRFLDLEYRLGDRIDGLEAKMDSKFDQVNTHLDALAKGLKEVKEEQIAWKSNYDRIDTTVERHDKEIVIIKRNLRLA